MVAISSARSSGIFGKPLVDLGRAPVEHLAHSQAVGAFFFAVRDLEEGDQKSGNALSPVALVGHLTATAFAIQCHGHEDTGSKRGGCCLGPVTPEELAGSIKEGRLAGTDRMAGEVTADIVAQLFHRAIAAPGILGERLQDDVVEVSPQPARTSGHGAGRLGPDLADRPPNLRQASTAATVRPLAAHQLVEQDTQGVHVAGRRDRLAEYLLRASKVRGHRQGPAAVTFRSASASVARSLAMPKSSSFTSPRGVTRMFEGLRSRWTTRLR